MNNQIQQYLKSMTDKEPPKCPNCATLLSRKDQIGAGEGASTMDMLGVKVVKIRCPKCKSVSDVTLPFGFNW